MTAAEFELLEENEAEGLICFRLRVLQAAGYPWDDALVLATHVEIQLQDACSLLRHGCPPSTAMRVLI